MDIALVGWPGHPVKPAGKIEIHLEPVDLRGDLPPQLAAIVLGPRVLGALDAAIVSTALERFGGATLIVWEPGGRSPWSEESAQQIGELVAPEFALQRALEVVRQRPLPRMPVAEWIGDRRFGLSPSDRALVRLVPRLPWLRAHEWANAAGISEHCLNVASRRLLAMNAGAALRDYRLRAVRGLRERGCTMQAIAPVLGYASRASVSRALRMGSARGA